MYRKEPKPFQNQRSKLIIHFMNPLKEQNTSKLRDIKAAFLDLDGVLWHGTKPIGNLQQIFSKFQKAKVIPILWTNNSTNLPETYQQKMKSFGVDITLNQIISPAIAAKYVFEKKYTAQARIHVFGSDALKDYLISQGLTLVENQADVVLVSLDQDATYYKIAKAMKLILDGAAFYATNLDHVLPSEKGRVPGAGSIVRAVQTCTAVKPVILGKPEPIMMQLVCEQFGFSIQEIVAVGDRYDTDMLAGIRAGCLTAMVLTGVDSVDSIRDQEKQPDYICSNLDEFANLLLERA